MAMFRRVKSLVNLVSVKFLHCQKQVHAAKDTTIMYVSAVTGSDVVTKSQSYEKCCFGIYFGIFLQFFLFWSPFSHPEVSPATVTDMSYNTVAKTAMQAKLLLCLRVQ